MAYLDLATLNKEAGIGLQNPLYLKPIIKERQKAALKRKIPAKD